MTQPSARPDPRVAGAGASAPEPATEGVGADAPTPDPEVPAKAQRRQFGAEYKRRILQEAEGCTSPGELGALLRREGLYSSHLTLWRRQRERGELQGLTPARRGRKRNAEAAELARLRRENEQLKQRLAQAEAIIAVQKKLSQLLGLSNPPEDGES